jgi:hypothetical protein
MSRRADVQRALLGAFAGGGFLASPPGLDGSTGLGIVGITGAPRPRNPWDVLATVEAPGLEGEEAAFFALADGTLVVEGEGEPELILPLATAVEHDLRAPYRAAAVRHERAVWAVAAWEVEILELPDVEGDVVLASRVDNVIELLVDDAPARLTADIAAALSERDGDLVLSAERIDGFLWAAEATPL